MFSKEIFQSSVMVRLGYDNGDLGLEAQRIFATLILKADDHGRGRLIPEIIRGDAFLSVPDVFAKVTPKMVMGWIEQIEGEGALIVYEADGQRYYVLTGWNKYQRGGWQKATSLLPDPPGFVPDKTLTGGGQAADGGRTTDESKVNQGKVKKRKEKKKPVKSADDLPEPSQPTAKSQELIRKLVATGKKFKPLKEPDIIKQAAVIDLINRKGPDETRDFHPDKLADALLWAVKDEDFWRAQVKSCLGLRRRMDNGCLKYENMMTAFERYQEKRFKTAWKSPEQRQREAKEQRDIQAENERRRIQKEKQLETEQKERDKQAETNRKNQEAIEIKAKVEHEKRLKQFWPDIEKFVKLWKEKGLDCEYAYADMKSIIANWLSKDIISGAELIEKLETFAGGGFLDFQKMLIAPAGYDEILRDL